MKEILLSGVIALFLSLLGTPLLIKVLAANGYGQMIREDGPKTHFSKRGTPTMGGISIIFSALAGYLIAHLLLGITFSASAILVICLILGLGIVGFIDDYLIYVFILFKIVFNLIIIHTANIKCSSE